MLIILRHKYEYQRISDCIDTCIDLFENDKIQRLYVVLNNKSFKYPAFQNLYKSYKGRLWYSIEDISKIYVTDNKNNELGNKRVENN